eukprot:m.1527757 g.1527757  ORF g.1527757 m.1527757 type:complete len:207 (+) comp25235_c0_seq5:10-630(+)
MCKYLCRHAVECQSTTQLSQRDSRFVLVRVVVLTITHCSHCWEACDRVKTMPKQRQLPNRDAFTRMNFLYQAAHFSMGLNKDDTDGDLARFYITSMKTIAKRLVLRAGSSVKQTICKKCNTPLIPGQSCRTRVYGNRQTHLVITCTSCGTFKRYPLRPNYKLHRKAVIIDDVVQSPTDPEMKQKNEKHCTATGTSEGGKTSNKKKV